MVRSGSSAVRSSAWALGIIGVGAGVVGDAAITVADTAVRDMDTQDVASIAAVVVVGTQQALRVAMSAADPVAVLLAVVVV
jgi:hypothetical protein